MATFQNIKELIRTLTQGQKLLFDMFQKRRTTSVRYNDALETLDDKEDTLQRMIKFGIIIQTGNTLELTDIYQDFFEKVLAVNEDINISSVKEYIDSLQLAIRSYLSADSVRRPQFLRQIRHTFRSIDQATHRNILDLKRNVEYTYKQEPNFKIKELRLKVFDEKCSAIDKLITHTEKLIDEESIFFSIAQDLGLKETVAEVKTGLKQSAHGLIAIKHMIIDYLNRIQYQGKVVKQVRKLKYLRDQLLINEATNIRQEAAIKNAVCFEPRMTFSTKVSLDYLRNNDSALDLLVSVRKKLNKTTVIKTRCAGAIDKEYIQTREETSNSFDHRTIAEAFLAQSGDLFTFVWNYPFSTEVEVEERLVLFLQLASQFTEIFQFTDKYAVKGVYEYPLIYPI